LVLVLTGCGPQVCNEAGTGPCGFGAGFGGGADGGEGGVVVGTGPTCPSLIRVTTASKLTLQAAWPASVTIVNGTGAVNLWLLANYHIDAQNNLAGTITICGLEVPPLNLSQEGAATIGAVDGGLPQVQIVIPKSTWIAPTMPAAQVTGVTGGWNVGSSLSIRPTIALEGLSRASTLADPMTTWPDQGKQIRASDIVDDDGDGHPGITGLARNDGGLYLPRVAFSLASAQVDQLYMVLRTEISLYGTTSSCEESSGSATVGLLNNHIIGCRKVDGTPCTGDYAEFIDYYAPARWVMSGTYTAQQLTTDADPTCDDALSALQ
jgi:hypothetical protein